MTRTTSTRLPELMSRERADLDALLAASMVGHIAFVDEDGGPGVLPSAIVPFGDGIVVHGSTGSRWMRRIATGVPVVVSVTAVDGIIVARSAFESSLAYRSAVLFGTFRALDGTQKQAALDALTEHLIPGRVREVRPSTKRELAATLVVFMPIDEWSLRVSDGWAEDPECDVAGDAWSGQVRYGERPATSMDAPDLRTGIPRPPSIDAICPSG
ncbi:pyridoxamine 5'-phosphate oxidase family protein [Homoserinimonas sp. OAct 916]|uniref:pyridoxamine 5'-phosphate oxidase family protein n=1 Tax=Homoserinimonas sp. OAct 916 TaxID=2211450 RepID=UPI001E3E716B|nr:pyridoxamine 5'-phosphate oxidase family protein [Homoserinimonas sp. OAct 916]